MSAVYTSHEHGLGGKIPLDAPKPLHWKEKHFEPYLQVQFKSSWYESNLDAVQPGFLLCIGYGKEYWMQSNFNSLSNDEIKDFIMVLILTVT